GVAGYNIFLCLGQGEVKPGAAALLTTLSPLFILILAVVFLRERVPRSRIAGIVIAFAGLYAVVRWGSIGLGQVTVSNAEIKYAMITALAPVCWTVYTILGRTFAGRSSPVTVTYLSLVFGTVPFIVVVDGPFIQTVLHMEGRYWIALIHLIVLCTIVGFWIWNAALQYLPATSVASFIYLNPPFAALSGWLLFSEEITTPFLAGSAVVLAGLYLAQRAGGGAPRIAIPPPPRQGR
ncbi:MAG TPA: DMT family transporter, partial [Patescibacteria group bacterium]|nr:DMT family transporter [Patescibacteria group bacterium]